MKMCVSRFTRDGGVIGMTRRVAVFLAVGGSAVFAPSISQAQNPTVVSEAAYQLQFDPARDGFSFANFPNDPQTFSVSDEVMLRLFGDSICSFGSGSDACEINPVVKDLQRTLNRGLEVGHCVGMSALAQELFDGSVPQVGQLGVAATSSLPLNRAVVDEIASRAAVQFLPGEGQTQMSPPSKVVSVLEQAFAEGSARNVLVLYAWNIEQNGWGGGHAVTPFAVEDTDAENVKEILIYDNNLPNVVQRVTVDLQEEAWEYEKGGQLPGGGSTGWNYGGIGDNGGMGSSMGLLDVSRLRGPFSCSICDAYRAPLNSDHQALFLDNLQEDDEVVDDEDIEIVIHDEEELSGTDGPRVPSDSQMNALNSDDSDDSQEGLTDNLTPPDSASLSLSKPAKSPYTLVEDQAAIGSRIGHNVMNAFGNGQAVEVRTSVFGEGRVAIQDGNSQPHLAANTRGGAIVTSLKLSHDRASTDYSAHMRLNPRAIRQWMKSDGTKEMPGLRLRVTESVLHASVTDGPNVAIDLSVLEVGSQDGGMAAIARSIRLGEGDVASVNFKKWQAGEAPQLIVHRSNGRQHQVQMTLIEVSDFDAVALAGPSDQ